MFLQPIFLYTFLNLTEIHQVSRIIYLLFFVFFCRWLKQEQAELLISLNTSGMYWLLFPAWFPPPATPMDLYSGIIHTVNSRDWVVAQHSIDLRTRPGKGCRGWGTIVQGKFKRGQKKRTLTLDVTQNKSPFPLGKSHKTLWAKKFLGKWKFKTHFKIFLLPCGYLAGPGILIYSTSFTGSLCSPLTLDSFCFGTKTILDRAFVHS